MGEMMQPAGELRANNSGLWFLVVDAGVAAGWSGTDGDGDDFERAMDVGEGEIRVGTGTGVLAPGGEAGVAWIWQVGDDFVLLGPPISMGDQLTDDACARTAKALSKLKRGTRLGTVEVSKGLIEVLLPYASGVVKKAAFAEAQRQPGVQRLDDERVLIGCANGSWKVEQVVMPAAKGDRWYDAVVLRAP